MVANIRSGSSPGGALYYNKEKVDKDEAEVLFWQKMLEPFDKHGRMDVDASVNAFVQFCTLIREYKIGKIVWRLFLSFRFVVLRYFFAGQMIKF